MEIAVIIVLVCVIAYGIHEIGVDKGYQDGFQDGRLDQHWYNQRITQKAKRK